MPSHRIAKRLVTGFGTDFYERIGRAKQPAPKELSAIEKYFQRCHDVMKLEVRQQAVLLAEELMEYRRTDMSGDVLSAYKEHYILLKPYATSPGVLKFLRWWENSAPRKRTKEEILKELVKVVHACRLAKLDFLEVTVAQAVAHRVSIPDWLLAPGGVTIDKAYLQMFTESYAVEAKFKRSALLSYRPYPMHVSGHVLQRLTDCEAGAQTEAAGRVARTKNQAKLPILPIPEAQEQGQVLLVK